MASSRASAASLLQPILQPNCSLFSAQTLRMHRELGRLWSAPDKAISGSAQRINKAAHRPDRALDPRCHLINGNIHREVLHVTPDSEC